MNKAHTAKQPSIEDLLASIRQAIHDDVAPRPGPVAGREEGRRSGGPKPEPLAEPNAGADKPAQSPSPASNPVRPEAEDRPLQRTIVTSGGQGFAGLLGGDVRLEEALARLSHAGRRPAAASERPEHPRLRPAIDQPVQRLQTGGEGPRRSAGAEAAEAPDQGREPAAAHPPWLRSDRSAASDREAGAAYDGAQPDPLWQDEAHRGSQRALASPSHSASHSHSHAHSASQSHAPAGDSDLLSSEAAAAASSAFNRLAETIVQRSTGGDRSLEEVTRDLLRPMLKSWLDHNLPRMVEQLVREEIARVARNGK